MNRSKIMHRAWELKNKKPWLSFSKCLKWSWMCCDRVRGVAQKAIASVDFVMENDFINGMGF